MAKETTYEEIARNLKNKIYAPVYFLMGEEDYYIDRIADYILEHVLTETEKEFNQTVLYGSDTDIATVINAAKRYPMMSKYQVLVVKEAQNLKNLEELSYYLKKPMPSTKQVEIEPKASEMMAEFVGTDLNRMAGELEKLIITLPKGQRRITPEQIERNIGISKDFNNFELRNALIEKDVFKANQIVKYFEENPKNNPLQVTLAVLFNFFSNLMLAYYAPEKNEQGIAAQLSLRSPWQARDYQAAMHRYTGVKVMRIIEAIRQCDVRSKGVGNASISDGELLRELVYLILH